MTISRDEDLYGTVVDHYIDKLGYTAVLRLNDGSRMKVAVGEGTHLGDKIYLGPTQRKLDPWYNKPKLTDKMADALRVPRDMLRGTVTGRIPSGSPSEPTGIKGVHVTTVITDDIDEEPDLAAVDFSKIEARVLAQYMEQPNVYKIEGAKYLCDPEKGAVLVLKLRSWNSSKMQGVAFTIMDKDNQWLATGAKILKGLCKAVGLLVLKATEELEGAWVIYEPKNPLDKMFRPLQSSFMGELQYGLAIPSPKKPETDAEQERKLEKLYPLPEPTYTKKQQPAAGPVATDQPNTYGEDKGKELSRAIGKTRLSMEATGWPMQEMIRLGQETVSTMDKESN